MSIIQSVVEHLLAQDDTDVNLKNKDGQTPLSFVGEQGSEVVLHLLLVQDDIDVLLTDKYFWTPMWLAVVEQGSEAVLQLIPAQDDIGMRLNDKCCQPVVELENADLSGCNQSL